MPLKNKCFLLITIILLAIACKDQTAPKQTTDTEPLKNGISESFWPFFETFQNDSIYQMEHIIFPLKGLPAKAEDMVEGESFYWQKEGWRIHRQFDDMGGTFQRSYRQVGHMVTETISDQSGTFQMERRFAKMDEDWMMIYYAAMRMVR